MKLYVEGDKGKAICFRCRKVTPTTFKYRNVPFSDGNGIVENILSGVCDVCDSVIETLPQSTPAIKRARERATESIEAVLPAPYVEALDLACFQIDPSASVDLRKRVLLYYVHQFAIGGLDVKRLKTGRDLLGRGVAMDKHIVRKRISFKVSKAMSIEFDGIIAKTALKKTDLLKSLVCEIKFDVLDRAEPSHIASLKAMAAVSMA